MAKILVADDDSLFREMVETMLTRHGHRVVGVGTVQNCLSQLHAEPFDLVLTDLHMPVQSDGDNPIALIREQGLAIPVIGMTGGRSRAGHALSPSVFEPVTILNKPFSPQQLATEIDKALL